jgi:hypothetical protein
MGNVADLMRLADPVERLSEDIEGILLCIAYAGKDRDHKYIRSSQRYLRREWGDCYDRLSCLGGAGTVIGEVIYNVVEAYSGIMEFFNPLHMGNGRTFKYIQERAEELLGGHILMPTESEVFMEGFVDRATLAHIDLDILEGQ